MGWGELINNGDISILLGIKEVVKDQPPYPSIPISDNLTVSTHIVHDL